VHVVSICLKFSLIPDLRSFSLDFSLNHCQQKRQQRCWKGAGPGSGGVELDSIVKSGIFDPENALKATDSDPRLHLQSVDGQGALSRKRANVSKNVSSRNVTPMCAHPCPLDRAIKDKALDLLRDRPLLETRAEHFLEMLQQGMVSTKVHLRKLPP
jgi:hypothetical protein